MKPPIYLDYNATTPLDQDVVEAMRPFWEDKFGNPSSNHWFGIEPKKAVEKARSQVSLCLGCSDREVVFTSGGTESNNHAIIGTAEAFQEKGSHIITSQIEHPSVLEVCRYLQKRGFEITYLPVDSRGLIGIEDLKQAIKPQTILISIMHANNEVGTIQPIEEIASMVKDKQIILHTDAAQSLGKIPVDVASLGVDLLTVAGHKLYAPKGIGALYIKSGLDIKNFIHGAGQEKGRRPGTENVLEIVGLGKACEIAKRDLPQNMRKMQHLTDKLYSALAENLEQIRLNSPSSKRLPNTLSLSFYNLEANRILEEIGLEVASSPGAACHSDRIDVSHVLEAMQVPRSWSKGTIRLSVGKYTSEDEVDKAVEVVVKGVQKLRTENL